MYARRVGLGVSLLSSTTLLSRRGATFSPASLFATGEQGAWYDPSDLTTLFQDSAGATPVTAAGQSVGLLLDKSQGLVLGPELVTNGDFSGGATGWTLAASATVSGGALNVNSVTTENFCVSTGVIPATSRTYLISFDVTRTSGAFSVFVGQVAAANQLFGTQVNTGGAKRGYVLYGLPGGASNTIIFRAEGGFVGSIDNVSVRELPGNHATQSNAAQRPTYGVVPATGRRNLLTFSEQFDNAAWPKLSATVSANAATAPDGTTTADNLVETATTAGHGFQFLSAYTGTGQRTNSIYVKANGRNRVALGFSTSGGVIANLSAVFDIANGTIITPPNPIEGSATITSDGSGWFRISVTLLLGGASTDRFALNTLRDSDTAPVSYLGDGTSGVLVWGAQGETGTTATAYQRVVSAFDVTEAGVASCSYLSFDGTDDGMLTGNIVPGTDKAQVFAGVRLVSAAGSGVLAEMSTNSDSTNGTLSVWRPSSGGGSQWYMQSRGTGGVSVSASGYPAPSTNVFAGTSDIAGDSLIIRVDGTQVGSSTADQGTGSFTTQPLYIGRRGGTTIPFNGQIFGLIVRFGTNLSAATVTATETWLGQRVSPTVNVPLWQSKTIYDRFEDTVLDRNNETIEVR